MGKIKTILKKEFKDIVKKKAFIIGTILSPIFFIGMIFLPSLIMMKVSKTDAKIAVVDLSGQIFTPLKASLEKGKEPAKKDPQKAVEGDMEGDGQVTFALEEIRSTSSDLPALEERLKQRIEAKELYGYLIVPSDFFSSRKAQLKAKNVANLGVVRSIEGSLRDIAERKLLKEENFPEDRIAELTKEVSLSTMKVEKGKEKKGGFIGEYLLSVLLVSLLFGVIMGYGQILMRGVVEEKNARIIEVLLSSVDSFRLLLGKVFGVGLAGLLQVGIWCFMLFGSYFYFTSHLPMEFQGFTLSPSIFLSFALFFVLGYFLYSTLFAIAGAVSNTDQEAQQFLQPIMFLILIPFIIAFSTIQNPDTTAVVLLSFFPFFTPILMFVRTAFSTPPLWQIALSLGLLVLTTLGITYLSAKIFRIGILSYGKKPNLKEILLWLKVK